MSLQHQVQQAELSMLVASQVGAMRELNPFSRTHLGPERTCRALKFLVLA